MPSGERRRWVPCDHGVETHKMSDGAVATVCRVAVGAWDYEGAVKVEVQGAERFMEVRA